MSTLLTIAVVVLVGARVRDALLLRQQELVLSKLARDEAAAYYEVLRRRVRNARILRAIAVTSLLALMYAWRHGLGMTLTRL